MKSSPISAPARQLHAASIVCDLTLPLDADYEAPDQGALFGRLESAGYTFASITVATDSSNVSKCMRFLARHRAYFEAQPERFLIVDEAEDIRRAKQRGLIAISFNLQGTNPLEQDLHMVEAYYALGIRHMLLAYNLKNSVGDGCHERTDAGLSRFGVELIRQMNRVGMIVDCSHTGYRTTLEALEISTSPVIFSHSNARALRDHERNIRDDQIRACARSGGVIGVNGVDLFLGGGERGADAMVQHIEYIAGMVGWEHVAIGLDHVVQSEELNTLLKSSSSVYPESGGYRQGVNIAAPEIVLEITEGLLRRGYSEAQIRGVLGENFLRVAAAVWRPAAGRRGL